MATKPNIIQLLAVILLVVLSLISISTMTGSATTAFCNPSEVRQVALGSNLNTEFDSEMSRNDICLGEESASVQGDDSDTKEILVLGHKSRFIGPATALTSADKYNSAVLEADDGSVKLFYIFENSIDLTKATQDSPLKIHFMGKKYEITKVTDTSFTAIVGNSSLMKLGSISLIGGKEVQLLRVSQSGTVIVSVDGNNVLISRGATEKISGIEVTNIESFYDSANLFNNFAELSIGNKAVATIRDGDKYNDDWSWTIGGLASTGGTTTSSTAEFAGPFIGIKNEVEYNSDEKMLTAGQCISLPDNYVQICFEGLTDEKYINLEINMETADLSAGGGSSSESTTHFKASSAKLKTLTASSNEIWITNAGTLYYNQNGVKLGTFDGTNVATIEDLSIIKSGSTYTLDSPRANDDLTFSFSGNSLSTAVWNGRSVIDVDGKLITKQGVIINANNDLNLKIPRDQVKAIINITSSAS